MSRFDQRLQPRLQDPEFAAGYSEMAAELNLIQALDDAREQLHISKEELAQRMGRHRTAISRILSEDEVNPTIGTITSLLAALGLTADITLRKATEGEAPLHVQPLTGNIAPTQ